ncbi:MAG: transporter permease [Herbinix sp.]|jgi:multiple sugar transport system permease protein|nr:transporter permease [Herbinix sp.]
MRQKRDSKFHIKNTAYVFMFPYVLLFIIFILLPVIAAIGLSFTNFNTLQIPDFIGFRNYIGWLTNDPTFMQIILPNTIVFAVVTGPVGYILAFFLAWSLSQVSKVPRTILALILYSPSMTGGVAMQVVWKVLFSGDRYGYVNAKLLQLGMIDAPINFLQSSTWLMPIMIVVTLWSSMGIGFLAMLAGIMNIDQSQYEAAKIDGIKNRFQEIIYVTVPNMKPQLMFGAVMQIVGSFQLGSIGVTLSGSNPTPLYAGSVFVTHIDDYGFIRYEMGYAAAGSVLLLLLIYGFSIVARRLFIEKD